MNNQNVVLKFGIGLALGLGMMVAPRTAQASTPCDSSPTDTTSCPQGVDAQYSYWSDTAIGYGCFDTDCNQSKDSKYQIETKHETFYYYPPGGGPFPGGTLLYADCYSIDYTNVGEC